MRRVGLTVLAFLFVLASAQSALAKKAKGVKKGRGGPAPLASSKAIAEFKGNYTWGMTQAQVLEKIFARIDEAYKERKEKVVADPMKSDQVREEIKREKDRVTKSVVKFDGTKTGWDVSIIDKEFLQNNNESMFILKEPKSTRYFFFANDALYKMFVAFDKDVLAGKTFEQFGAMMMAKYGKAQPVYVDRQVAPGVKERVLDHYLWRSEYGDGLRLVDRSAFYDVYCLVIYDNAVAHRQDEIRKNLEAQNPKESFVDSVFTKEIDRDENDNVVDRLTGKDVLKPGERRGGNQNIVVPSTSGGTGQ